MKKLYLLTILLIGCGQFEPIQIINPNLDSSDHIIVKARSYINITMEKQSMLSKFFHNLIIANAFAANSNTAITVIVANNTQFNINSTGFSVPVSTITDTLNFGSLVLNTLRDNTLDVCGVAFNEHCSTAVLRIYTIGTDAGLYNADDHYSAPIKVTKVGVPTVVGLNVANAVIMDTLSLPNNKHVVHLNDFIVSKTYTITADFSNAGSGTYSTTLVIEYGLE